ncbi:MAG: efflux RND transporter permease subunit, partial [Planctomycetaceae bacterium]|nr:efflux RND transporter permease subunit [Planctomycetaceae bacterium]
MILRTVRFFLDGPFSVLLIVASLLLGAVAILITPREEDPQIVVPMVDVEVSFPGHSPGEVEELVTRPLERILWQLDGVEHVYSVSQRDGAVVTVRFYVGQDRERAMVRIHDTIEENKNIVPDGVAGWRVIPVRVDDVPIVTLTLTSKKYHSAELRRFAEELSARLDSIADISKLEILGGLERMIRIEPILENFAAHQLCFPDLINAIQRANAAGTVGTSVVDGQNFLLMTDPGLIDAESVANIVVSVRDNRLVRVRDLAHVTDQPKVPENYVRCNGEEAVTIAVSKKKGVNAVNLSERIIRQAGESGGVVLP